MIVMAVDWANFVAHRGATPVYVQLADWIESQIKAGNLAPGDQLPSQREMRRPDRPLHGDRRQGHDAPPEARAGRDLDHRDVRQALKSEPRQLRGSHYAQVPR